MDSEYPKFAVHSEQGRRVTMEDMHLILDDCRKDYGEYVKDRRLCYFGVYDGHGGKDAAIWTQKLLHDAVLKDPSFSQNIEDAIRNGFSTADKQLLIHAKEDNFTSGSTVVLGILDTQDNLFYIGNVGDSEAVMGRRNEQGGYDPVVLTVKHKPSDQSEKDRIKKAGGHVVFGRVMGTLAVARSLGDRDFKHPFNKGEADFVSAEPYVSKTPITPEDDFLILSCDGLWDKMSYEQAIEMVATLKNSGKTPEETVEILVKDSIEKGSMDNVTAIVVYLGPPRAPKEEKKGEEEEGQEADVMDVWEFLKTECERKDKEKETQKLNSKLKIFNIPPEEEVVEEFPCALEKKLLYQGTMILTQNFLCFHSTRFGRNIVEQININDIESVEKQKTLLVSNAIRITTKDGKKLFFNWKQNARSRDQVFSKLLDIIAKLDETPQQKVGLGTSPRSVPKLALREDDRGEISRSAPSTPHQQDSGRDSKLTKSEEAPAVLQSGTGTGRERRGETKAPPALVPGKTTSSSEVEPAQTETADSKSDTADAKRSSSSNANSS